MLYLNIGYHFWGMHAFWWMFWVLVLIWIYATPYDIPGQRTKKEDALDVLKKRLAKGEIETEEFLEKKKVLDKLMMLINNRHVPFF
ncbi:MAG: SHOCT domain-containing protein [Bacteroidia bacterium]|nr:SHOCT domain-containing protein [Bacteroidia bacterium]